MTIAASSHAREGSGRGPSDARPHAMATNPSPQKMSTMELFRSRRLTSQTAVTPANATSPANSHGLTSIDIAVSRP